MVMARNKLSLDCFGGIGGMATGFRAIILAGLAIGGVGGFVVPDLKLNDAVVQDRGEQALSGDQPFGALHATAIAKRDSSDVDAEQTRPEGLGTVWIRLTLRLTGIGSRPSLLRVYPSCEW